MRLLVDPSVPLAEESEGGHNRWHPDIEPIAVVPAGSKLTLETRDGLDGQLGPESTHADITEIDLGRGHPLTGPVLVEGARPGDVLEVEFLDYETAEFGFTAVIPGVGLLGDLFPDPFLVKWEIAGGVARSAEMPGVTIAGEPFAGNVGVAPSHELMDEMRRREEAIAARGEAVAPQAPRAAVPGKAADGLRTVPPRETGGNLDVRQLVAGSRLLLPVSVPGALFSIGDIHFAQGDGEVCGTAIEMAGAVTVRLTVRQGSAEQFRLRLPTYETPGRMSPSFFATTGIPVDAGMDIGAAAREAVLQMIDYLVSARRLEPQQAYALCSVAVDLRVSEMVNVPYPVVSALLPHVIFS